MPIKIGNLTVNTRVYVPPMAGVTDIVFRKIIRDIDPNCLLATEMVSSKALLHKPDTNKMDLVPGEDPIAIQIFGHEPDVMANAAQMAEAKGANWVDINMGCPVPKITKGKDGCALMREPDLAKEIVQTVKAAVSIPVTVKFRLGWDDNSRNAVDFGLMLEKAGASMVTVHGRTRQQLYSGKADWSFIARVKQALSIPVLGNGDVFEPEDAARLLEETGCDGVAVARGTLGNPWLISRISHYLETGQLMDPPTDIERLICAYKHALGLIKYKGLRIGTNESRRHLTHYTKGIPGSAPYRARLTQINNQQEMLTILSELAEKVSGKEGQKSFLLAVEHNNFENGKEPDKGSSNNITNVFSPVNVLPFLPIAIPENAIGHGNH